MGSIADNYGSVDPDAERRYFGDWYDDLDSDDREVVGRWLDSQADHAVVQRLINEAAGTAWAHATIANARKRRRG